ncbi:MAG: phage/plasmid primase, P4 family [Candidatus Omnitrophica bacterium]|nr:phage/plasmid primase, P4 family [Candidatus Omnitrophota bacterium]
MKQQIEYALAYAGIGLRVFPCADKKPLTQHGFKDATCDSNKIKEWWQAHPDANIGISTGEVSGITVVDVDPRNGGMKSLEDLKTEHGLLPETVMSETGGGGLHLYYKYDVAIKSTSSFRSGIDIKSDGGYVIAPASTHESGKKYKWVEDRSPMEICFMPPPEWLRKKEEINETIKHESDTIGLGNRNSTLLSFAGTMQKRNMSHEAIKAALLEENQNRCKPPLCEDEIIKIAESIERYRDISEIDIEEGQPTSIEIAKVIIKQNNIIHCAYGYYTYAHGVYNLVEEEIIKKWIIDFCGPKVSKGKVEAVLYFIESAAHVRMEDVNNSEYINLKNGLFALDTQTLYEHSPSVYSTIQLKVSYNPSAKCDKWLKTLAEIFEGNDDKIETLQEFLGLCFTKETKYEKALLAIGEGANGKSVIFNTAEKVIGRDNTSAIPLEKFNNTHYTANLFGKLANISIETNAKSEVYDSIFKAVVSGDMIEADLKFKNSFRFNPFCKLIFAMNNLPRVDDKTDAFFRRLLILQFDRQFKEEEQNKNLKAELLDELDGIFMWCLEGLKRLKARGFFTIPRGMQSLIDEYRRDNNNVMVFAEECCSFDDSTCHETKDDVYRTYAEYCKESGYRPLGKGRFGTEFAKHYNLRKDDRHDGERIWTGVKLLACPPQPDYK